MKPLRFCAYARTLVTSCIVTFTTGSTLAVDYYWDGSAGTPTAAVPGNPGTPAYNTSNWADAANWSTTSTANGSTPATAVTAAQVAVFSATSVGATQQIIHLNGTQAAEGLRTVNQISTTTLLGGSASSILSIGASGINHVAGGLAIGSTTPGQEVNVSLLDSQTWTSSAAGTNPAALTLYNGVSLGVAEAKTLTLSGFNMNSAIHGSISDGAGTLSIVKTGTGIWTLNGANTYTGTTTVSSGRMVLGNGTQASAFNVASGATLALKLGGSTGFNAAGLNSLYTGGTFAAGSLLELDTSIGSVSSATNFSGGINFTKSGSNDLTLTGTNTYTGTTNVSAGRLIIGTPGNLATFNVAGGTIVASGATLVVSAGGSGFTGANIDTLIGNVNNSGTLQIDVAVGNDVAVAGGLSGTGTRLTKSSSGALVLTGNSTYGGTTVLSAGTLAISDLAALGSGGQINLGSSGNVVTRFRYTGETVSTARTLRLDGSTSGAIIEADGTGALAFTTAVAAANGSKTLTLTGHSSAANTMSAIGNYGSGNATTLLKTGSGTWVLNGANTYSGNSTVNGGTLVFDYSAGNDALGTSALISQTGDIIIKGSAGGTTDTIKSVQLGVENTGINRLILDPNGGALNLTITSLVGSSASQHHDLIDMSAGGTITVTGLTSMATTNGVLMNSASSGARASLVVRDGGGYGFAALSGGTTGTLQKLGTYTTLSAGTVTPNAAAGNFFAGAGTYTTGGSITFNTLTLDSTAGAVNFTFAGSHTVTASTGKAVLISGGNNVNISGGGSTLANTALWFHNYLGDSATLNYSSSLGTSNVALFGGTGFTNYSGSGFGSTFILNGGVFRSTRDQTSTSIFRLSDAVFEIGADLNGATAGDLTFAIGTAAGTFGLYGDSGLSAYTAVDGGTRVADFTSGGVSMNLVWGSTHFLSSVDPGGNGSVSDGDNAFKLSSSRSNATIEVRNNIDLDGRSRLVDVANGSAAVDAVLSGTISGTAAGSSIVDSIASDLVKGGAGTLALTGTNTYGGYTTISAGTLQIGNGGATGTLGGGAVRNYGTLAFNRSNTITVANQISGTGSLVQAGAGTTILSGANTYSGTTTVSSGTLLINGNQGTATGTVLVSAGATLGGSGTVGGATTIAGVHAPGNSPGTQTFNSSLTYAGGSTFSWELTSETTAGAGINFDSVVVNGALAVNNTTYRINITNLNLNSTFWDANRSWAVFDADSISGNFFQFVLYDTSNAGNGPVDYSNYGTFSFNAATGSLNWSAVPEPTNALAGALIAAGLLRRRRSARA